MSRTSPLAFAAVLLLTSSCTTTGAHAPEQQGHASASGVYVLDLAPSFELQEAMEQYDSFFVWPARDWAVGVILDGPPAPMEVLDEAVRKNAVQSGLPSEVVRMRDVELGGLYARRSELVLKSESAEFLQLNTHTSTENGNVQLLVMGPMGDAPRLRALSEELERGGFRFQKREVAFKARPPHKLDDPQLPVRFSGRPDAWVTAPRGSVNEHAFLELSQPDADMWFMGIYEKLEGELAVEAVNDSEYVDRYARVMHDEMASLLQAVPPGDLAPFDEAGERLDRRWSLGGHFIEGKVPITYRFRLVQRGPEFLRLYCWGQANVNVKQRCDALFDVIELAEPSASAP